MNLNIEQNPASDKPPAAAAAAASKNLPSADRSKASESGPSNRRGSGSLIPPPEEFGRRPSLLIGDKVCIVLNSYYSCSAGHTNKNKTVFFFFGEYFFIFKRPKRCLHFLTSLRLKFLLVANIRSEEKS